MLRFLVSFAFVWLILFIWAMVVGPSWTAGEYWMGIGAKLLGVPTLCAWAGVSVVTRWRRPRALHPMVKATARLVSHGAGAGLLSAVLTAVVLAGVPMPIPDVAVVGLCATAAAAIFAACLPKARDSHCVFCGYQVETLDRCPECGHVRPVSL